MKEYFHEMDPTDPVILLTIDVEDWFQVENFKQCIPYSSWSSCELRVEKNTHRLLDLFDSVNEQQTTRNTHHTPENGSPQPVIGPRYFLPESDENNKKSSESCKSCQPKATFFILGWIAERLPNLVREIHVRGHEVASHGYHHELCNKCSSEELKRDLMNSKKLLEDTIGAPVYGYRAPSFSVNDNILSLIQEAGYLYDSSYNSFGLNSRYGKLTLSSNGTRGIAIPIGRADLTDPTDPTDQFYELPISNLNVKRPFSYLLSALSSKQNQRDFVLPWGGGGYFRLIPYRIFQRGIKKILEEQGAYLFYMHPWEIDPDQPRVNVAKRSYKFRHYTNLDKTYSRLEKILHGFNSCRFTTCSQYLNAKVGRKTDNRAHPQSYEL